MPEDPTLAYCKICGKKIRAHKGDIEKHQKTKRHLKKQTTSDILADLIPISCGKFRFGMFVSFFLCQAFFVLLKV